MGKYPGGNRQAFAGGRSVVVLTGEYGSSCLPQVSRGTTARIRGAASRPMPGPGRFLHAENPPLFVTSLPDALDTIHHLSEETV